jgi:hypothetical protein
MWVPAGVGYKIGKMHPFLTNERCRVKDGIRGEMSRVDTSM